MSNLKKVLPVGKREAFLDDFVPDNLMDSVRATLSWREQIEDKHVNALVFVPLRWSFASSAGIVVISVPESMS